MSCDCDNAPKFPTQAFIPGPIEIPVTFRGVTIPADQGDDVANPPLNGAYRNVVLKYAANGHTYIYSSDGIPIMLVGSVTFDSLPDRPKYDGQQMTSHTNIPDFSGDIATLQNEIQALATDFSYKGSVEDYAHLPNDAAVGDVYTTLDDGIIYVWDGSEWVALNDNIPFKPFPTGVNTTGTTQEFMDSILALSPKVGMAYLGTVSLSDMPAGLIQEEVEVYVYSNYVLYCIMRSTDVAPYAWWCASYNYQGWKQVSPAILQATGQSTDNVMSQKAVTDTIYVPNSNESSIRIGKNASVTDASAAIGIGRNVSVSANGATAIGDHAQAGAFAAIAIGGHANASAQGAIALGEYSDSHTKGLIQVGSAQINCTYNNSGYRLLSGLYDPQTAHDAATKGYVDGITTRSDHAPNSNFAGTVGQLWEDTTNGDLYICTAVTPQGTDPETYTYTWEEFSTTSDLAQTTGQSTTVAMSQKAITDTLFNNNDLSKIQISGTTNGSSAIAIGGHARQNYDVCIGFGTQSASLSSRTDNTLIGHNAFCGYSNGTAIGSYSQSTTQGVALGYYAQNDNSSSHSVAIGPQSKTYNSGSVAIGAYSEASGTGVVSIGIPLDSSASKKVDTYNGSCYRLLTGVYDGQSAHDAATKGQLDGLITMTDTDPGEGVTLEANHFIAYYQ